MVSIPVYSEHCVKNNVQYCFYARMWSTEIQCMPLNVDFIFKIYHVFDRDTMYNIKVPILFSEPIMFFTDTVYDIKVLILFSRPIMFLTEIQCTTLKYLFYFHGISCVVVIYVIKVLILFSRPTMVFTGTVYNIKVFILFSWHIVCCSKICH